MLKTAVRTIPVWPLLLVLALRAYYKRQAWCRDAARSDPSGAARYRKLRLGCIEKLLGYYRLRGERYFLPSMSGDRDALGNTIRSSGESMYAQMMGLYLTEASDEQWERAIAEWAKRYDDYPGFTPHSDFFRLKFLAVRGNKAGYPALLSDMQRRHPKHKDPYWRQPSEANKDIYRLFDCDREHTTGHPKRSSSAQWRRGEQGIGDLPYVGYDPQKDTKKPEPWNP